MIKFIGSPGFAAAADPPPAVGPPLHPLQANAVVGGILVWRRPDAKRVAWLEEVLGDAGAIELRDAHPFGSVDLRRVARALGTLHKDPGMRVLVLELDDVAFDFDRIRLEVVHRERMMRQQRRARCPHGDPDGDTDECDRFPDPVHWLSLFASSKRSAFVSTRSGFGACTVTCRSKSIASRSRFAIR